MDVRILGPLEVERDGEVLNLGGKKQRSVLAALVVRAGEVIGAEKLADEVWDGEPPASADTTLRGYVSNLRKVIEPDRGPKDPARILRTTPSGYVLDVDDEQIDARRFERLVARGRERRTSDDVAGAIEDWSEALGLWRGDALQDFAYDGFAQGQAARLSELRLVCTEDLFDARLELGEHDVIVGDLEAFSEAHPSRERTLRLRMLALYRCGRQADALNAYEQGRHRLAEELGVDPSPELRALHEQILRQDESVSGTARLDTSRGKQTLTFLLGDVERSTEMLRALGDEYADALEAYRRLLQEAFGEHGGRGVRTWGDGVFAAFHGATDAVDAAVATQLALSRAGDGEDRTLTVRMGLHTGEATHSDGEFVGLSIHLAARIMDAAHGGQVLVSQSTRDLVEAEEGSEVGFVDTGSHALKDFPDTMRLFQVVHPELRRDFPPLRTRSGRTDNLPNRLKSFVGRDRDLERIESALGEARVVTLTGVGGVGKTSLAVEVGRRLVHRYPDGVWLCELASVDDAETVIHEVATTIGVERQPGRSTRESLLGALRQRESLLILDNCEHLLTAVAELVEDIALESRTTDVLATSREALGAEGERISPVRSLATDDETADAMRLFEDRASDARPDFTIDERNAADVRRICSRLDGIPLAIELAAARVTSMAPAQIANRLEEDFRFLHSGRRGAVDRHRTLQGAIAWQYDLLSEAEAALFDRVSVFAGGFTLEAAEMVCGRDLGLDVADGLASLVAKSLVEADITGDEARYALLETMRQYGQDRLAERGESDEVLEAHAMYFADLMEELDTRLTASSESVMPRLREEFDNLRAAHAWATGAGRLELALRIALRAPLWSQLQYPEMFGWVEAAMAMTGAEDHELFPTALTVAYLQGGSGFGTQDEMVTRVLAFLDDPDDVKRVPALMFAALVAAGQGRLDDAERTMEEFDRAAEATSAPATWQVFGFSGLSMPASNAGEHDAAVELAERGRERSRQASTALQGASEYYLGEALLAQGDDLERARRCFDRALELFDANQMVFWRGVTLVALASLRARHGDPADALPMFDELIDRWRRLGDRTRLWVTIRNLAELFGRMGLDAAAATLITASQHSATAPPSAGAQGERLEALSAELRARMGEADFEAACARARTMSDDEVVDHAKARIDEALATVEA